MGTIYLKRENDVIKREHALLITRAKHTHVFINRSNAGIKKVILLHHVRDSVEKKADIRNTAARRQTIS